MKSKLTEKITKRILLIIVTLNIILILIISYFTMSNYNKNIISSMENINISSTFIFNSINQNEDILGVINSIKGFYNVDVYVLDRNGESIIGNEIYVNLKRKEDVDYESNIVINVDNGLTTSKGITVNALFLNNKYFGELVLVKDFSAEYINTIFSLVSIVISQIMVILALLKLVSSYIERSLNPLYTLKEGIIKYGNGEEISDLSIITNDEIEDLSKSFINMVEEINSEKRKTVEFFNNATHELKTPITAISGYVQALTKRPIEEINLEFRNRAFYRIDIESNKLLTLVEKLLDISRGTIKRENLIEEVNIVDVTNECIKSLENRSSRNVFIIESRNTVIKANKDDITTIIYNLIDNAVKYSKSEIIKITIKDRLEIFKIENEIYEMPENVRDKLLDPFIKYNYKLEEKREEKISSSGLGLYLCSSLAKVNSLNLGYYINDDKIIVTIYS